MQVGWKKVEGNVKLYYFFSGNLKSPLLIMNQCWRNLRDVTELIKVATLYFACQKADYVSNSSMTTSVRPLSFRVLIISPDELG